MPTKSKPSIPVTNTPEANDLLVTDPLALLIGMLLDQQVPMETAFAGPAKLRQRLGHLDAGRIAAHDPEAFVEICKTPPSVHRFPGSMAGRIQALCAAVGDDVSAIWSTGDGAEILARLEALPGFGSQKARIFLALLGKQYGLTAPGWREASAPYGEEGSYRSVADIVDPASLTKVREFKKAAKAAAQGKEKTSK